MDDRFDCIIVGGGPAGITAAYRLASEGLSAAVFERGESPGSKNIIGGVLYSTILNRLIREFWEEAPVERHVTRRRYSFLSEDSEAALDLRFDAFNRPPFNNSFTILRAGFDSWFAKKAEDAGALIITGSVVDDFIREDGRVVGVKVRREGGEVRGDVVICAEGANSLLAEKAGLKRRPKGEEMILGVKEVVSLPEGVIEDRFGVEGGEGAAMEFFGGALSGLTGSGFIYTNSDTLSVGIGAPISVLKKRGIKPNELIEAFKKHPSVRDYLRGGVIEEFSAHMIPEGGYDALPELVSDGIMLVGDCAGFINPSLYREGSNMAMASGLFAAETVIEAKRKGDFSKGALNGYIRRLEDSFVLKDLKRYRGVPALLRKTPDLFKRYPEALLELIEGHFTISEKSKEDISKDIKKRFLKKVSIWRFLLDMYRVRRVWR